MMTMTSAELSAILCAVLQIPRARADLHAPHMLLALSYADVCTPQRLAHWLGQVGHESGRLRYMREIWGPTVQQLRYEPGTTLAQRLGNVRPGDGMRYAGRGLIQVTGRANYRGLTRRIRQQLGADNVPDFEAAPALLQGADWAAMSAADYWRSRSLNAYADSGDIYTLTRRINGGTNGLADRQAIYAHACSVLGAHHVD